MASRGNLAAVLAVLCFTLSPRGTFGQFILGAEIISKVTDPPVRDLGDLFIENIAIQSAISSGLASTSVTVRLINKANADGSTSFNILMPLDALISNYTVSAIGEDKYFSSDEASKIFDFEVSERGSNVRLFSVDVTVPAESAMELKLVSNGYFLHRITPQGLSPIAKSTLFVVDTSDSMAGTKLENAQIALRNFIGGMKATDSFNVISFSDVPKSWRRQPVRATSNSKISALNFIENMETGPRGTRNVTCYI
ncbi:Inter-alpha-trypsin inhibitor heavy chain H3 [Holothuria leucospilota]|uniref:Inter-alpha-trypsin inhibitor heavy chain H3 n=1 Tax=Holothuria leucospilota TaxID=206669 RepID=A0A9Q1CIZ1_HOLLE|nr:Inter-alpha-trypsin inhibitor heavy chain H3 [Holothuria leucospilota]